MYYLQWPEQTQGQEIGGVRADVGEMRVYILTTAGAHSSYFPFS